MWGRAAWASRTTSTARGLALNETFRELEPKSFRLIASWAALGDPGYLAQIQDRIDRANAAARTPGGMEIAVSFSVPPQTWQGVALTGQAWFDQVKPFIDRFTEQVEWWSPMNEPALKGWTFTPAGASLLADFSVRLKNYLDQAHPTDRLMSPDFNDHYAADGTLEEAPRRDLLCRALRQAVRQGRRTVRKRRGLASLRRRRRKSFLSTDDLVTTLSATSGAGLPIWVTEAGARADDTSTASQTEAEQDAQVRWMTDTSAGLASHDGITRMHYYNMREEPDTASATCRAKADFPWDTGLVRACGDKRPAWYTWCLASRANDAACFDDSPGAASWNSSRLDVLWRGNGDDAAVYRRWWDTKAWSSVSSLGGGTTSSPAVVAPASKRLDLYVRGADNAVWQRRYDGVAWSLWSSLGAVTYASPAASARRGTSIVDLFVRGTDNALYHRYRNGTAWSPGWVSIGAPPGGATSAPASISSSTGRIDVFVRGADSAIWRRTWTTSWSPWTSLGGVATSAPSATSRGTDSIDLFVRGSDGQIYPPRGAPWAGRPGARSAGPRSRRRRRWRRARIESTSGPRAERRAPAQVLAGDDRVVELERGLVRRPARYL